MVYKRLERILVQLETVDSTNSYAADLIKTTHVEEGLTVLSFYLRYRALVHAKVAALRFEQKKTNKNAAEESLLEFESYLELAKRYTHNIPPGLIVMRGLSASGKSTVAQQVVDEIGAIRVRSDVERKRLFNISLPIIQA